MLTPVQIHDQAFICPSWNEMGELTVKLAQKIKENNGHYDRIIALAKGGWGWARQLQDLLAIQELSGVQISFYDGIGKTKQTPVVIQSLPISINGEKILVYDDVVDSGETVRLAKDYLAMHGATQVDTATHFTKSWTKIDPDYSAFDTDAWIIFPHDALESMLELIKKWSDGEAEENFKKIGLHPELINFALKK